MSISSSPQTLIARAFGFHGDSLLATPWARDAIARRRIIARPEKYCIRGEWSTESRLLKYSARGFCVVDLGLKPDAAVPNHPEIDLLAAEASTALNRKVLQAGGGTPPMLVVARRFERKLRAVGVHGAQLLLLAAMNPGLREVLLFDVPLLPAGMGSRRLLECLSACDASLRREGYEGHRELCWRPRRRPCKLQVLYPRGRRCNLKAVVMGATEERHPDGNCRVRCWYQGLTDEVLQPVL